MQFSSKDWEIIAVHGPPQPLRPLRSSVCGVCETVPLKHNDVFVVMATRTGAYLELTLCLKCFHENIDPTTEPAASAVYAKA